MLTGNFPLSASRELFNTGFLDVISLAKGMGVQFLKRSGASARRRRRLAFFAVAAALTLLLPVSFLPTTSLLGQTAAFAAVPKKDKTRKVVLRKPSVSARRPRKSRVRSAAKSSTRRKVTVSRNAPPPSPAIVAPVMLPDEPPKPSELSFHPAGYPVLDSLDPLRYIDDTRSFGVDREGNKIYFTLIPDLQLKARSLLQRYSVPYGSIVALEPQTGRVLAMASYSAQDPQARGDLSTRAPLPSTTPPLNIL